MNKTVKLFLFGFLSWLIPFIVAMPLYPLLNESMPYLFKTSMLLTGALSGMWLLYLYFKKIESSFIKEGFVVGIVWFIMNFLLDIITLVLLFQSPFMEWLLGVGLGYLAIIVYAVGIGALLEKSS